MRRRKQTSRGEEIELVRQGEEMKEDEDEDVITKDVSAAALQTDRYRYTCRGWRAVVDVPGNQRTLVAGAVC